MREIGSSISDTYQPKNHFNLNSKTKNHICLHSLIVDGRPVHNPAEGKSPVQKGKKRSNVQLMYSGYSVQRALG